MNSTYEQVISNLEYLHLDEMRNHLDETIDFVTKNDLSFLEGLERLSTFQKERKQTNMVNAMVKVAGFPRIKTIDEFDFSYQPNLKKSEILDLMSLRFIDLQENVVFIGSSGVGKTHLASAIGYKAATSRKTTYFIKFQELISQLKKAYLENRFESKLKTLGKYKVLIIDEIGYLPISEEDAKLFFQVIDRRYEKSSTIITSNLNFSQWDTVFTNAVTANAILDRLLHHSKVISITGKSYRLKDHLIENDDDQY